MLDESGMAPTAPPLDSLLTIEMTEMDGDLGTDSMTTGNSLLSRRPSSVGQRNDALAASAAHGRPGWFRSAKFIVSSVVHVTNLVLKVWTLTIYFRHQEYVQMACQLVVESISILLSVQVAFRDADVQRLIWGQSCVVRLLTRVLVLLIFGVLQAIHVKRAWARQIHVADVIMSLKDKDFLWTGPALGAEPALPIALLTGVPSALISSYTYIVFKHSDLETDILMTATISCILVVSLAVVEVDVAISAYVARRYHFNPRAMGTRAGHWQWLYPAFHALYRTTEVLMRVMSLATLLAFLEFLLPRKGGGELLACVFFALDYLGGVLLSRHYAPSDESKLTHAVVGVGLILANVVRFIDMPGFARPAQVMSRMLETFRFAEFVMLLLGIGLELYLGYRHKWPDLRKTRWELGITVLLAAAITHYALRVSPIFTRQGDDLHSAVVHRNMRRLQKLLDTLDSGVALDVNGPMKDTSKLTPAMLAAKAGNLEALRLLFEAGARVQPVDSRGETCLHHALRAMQIDALSFLVLQRGAREVLGGPANKDLQRLILDKRDSLSTEDREYLERLLTVQNRRRHNSMARVGQVSVKPQVVSGEHLAGLFPDAVQEEVPPPRELCCVGALVIANSLGPLAQGILRGSRDVQGTSRMGALESLRRVRVLGQGAFGQVIEVEVAHGSPSSQSSSTFGIRRLMSRQRAVESSSSLASWIGQWQDERFAMKLQPKAQGDTEWRVCSEALALQRVAHPFVVRLVHAFQTPQFFALLLELCSEGDLNQLLCKTQDGSGYCTGLPVEDATRYTGQVLLALTHLHQVLRTVYRDLKPENVLISSADTAKLTDFGCAKYIGSRSRRRMSLVGTKGFLAPELFTGVDFEEDDREEDPDALDPFLLDSYSYGVLLKLTLLGEDVGERAEDEGVWLLPRAEPEADSFETLQACMRAGRLSAEGHALLLLLLTHDPRLRRHLYDPLVKEHHFFLKTLGGSNLEAALLPAMSPT